MKLLAVDDDGTHYFAREGCTETAREIAALLRVAREGIYWFAKALKRSRPAMKWEV
jgi:hypothetical protein